MKAGISYAPGKAANTGGAGVLRIEISQDSMIMSWSWEEGNRHLRELMREIHDNGARCGREDGRVNCRRIPDTAGFIRVAGAMVTR
jgi:glutamate dehydrogenase (NADP+)